MSWVYYKQEKFEQAAEAMDFVLQKTGGNVSNPDTLTYLAYILHHNGKGYQAKQVLGSVLASGRSFRMKPDAQALYEKVKGAQDPKAAEPAKKP